MANQGWGNPPQNPNQGYGQPPAGQPPSPYGNPPPQQGGFGSPPAHQGGYGSPPAQQGGFGAPPGQPGGFGAPQQPAGGFAAAAPGSPGLPGGAGGDDWSAMEPFSAAWRIISKDFAGTIVPYLVAILVGAGIPGMLWLVAAILVPVLSGVLGDTIGSIFGLLMMLFSALVTGVVSAWIGVGMMSFTLKLLRGESYTLKDVFRVDFKKLISVLIAGLLIGLLVGFASLFLVIPGILVAVLLYVAPWYVIDTDKGIIESIKASFASSKPYFGKLLLAGIIAYIIQLIGGMVVIGQLITTPLILVASGWVYLRVSGQRIAQ